MRCSTAARSNDREGGPGCALSEDENWKRRVSNTRKKIKDNHLNKKGYGFRNE
uniref:Uncharacterized protein n=1 Tax=Siphoviridae sp. ctBLh2 TaxID=2827803 RepID=A0A8S5S3Q7_9CAUD|nr:MAG TPA: hypothetical protein [Siphoviridae sp. ctBLh2]